MHNWFECKVKYDKNGEEGKIAKVSETYLVDAMTFTEAEERIIEEMTPFISGEFEVANIRKMKIGELFPNPAGDRWYRCKVLFIEVNDEGVEKRSPVAMLAQAATLKEGLEVLERGLKGTLADYTIASIIETAIIDVYFYGDKAAKVVAPAENTTEEE
jgi:hypothetical protein